MHLKLVQKEQFKKQLKQLVIQLAINSLIKFKKSQKKQNTIILRQSQMSLIKNT